MDIMRFTYAMLLLTVSWAPALIINYYSDVFIYYIFLNS